MSTSNPGEHVSCSSFQPLRTFCRDGFPQTAACWGGEGVAPICCSEVRCARMFPATGAPSPEWVAKCRSQQP